MERIEKIRKILPYGTAALINNPISRRYLTGFPSSAGSVVITPKRAVLLIDFRYFEKASQTVQNMEVRLCKSLYSEIGEILQNDGVQNIIPETHYITVNSLEAMKKALPDFNVLNDSSVSEKLRELRQIKTEKELKQIKKAQQITDRAFEHILNFIKVGVTEREIALELEFFMRRQGSEGVAFDTIAVSGKNSSLPHGVPTEKQLEKGDFLTMDFGGVCGGYCADMTRTVALGFVTDEQRNVYETVLKAQRAVLDVIAPKKKCKDMDAVARNIIAEAGFVENFGHGLGHSVGLEIHENPACNTRDETELRPGMLMTVEPGIYLSQKFGVRIEDLIVITADGCENLTESPKNLIIL